MRDCASSWSPEWMPTSSARSPGSASRRPSTLRPSSSSRAASSSGYSAGRAVSRRSTSSPTIEYSSPALLAPLHRAAPRRVDRGLGDPEHFADFVEQQADVCIEAMPHELLRVLAAQLTLTP
jgi:hypothetical protein